MKIAICDDEKKYIDEISDYISKIALNRGREYKVFICKNGYEIVRLCKKVKLDAIFLDIAMPGFDGFETAKQLLEIRKNIIIIFVSSQEGKVFNSYEYQPFWFVPKSNMQILDIVVDKMIDKIENYETENALIAINVEHKKVIEVNLKEILYFKTNDHYLQAVYKDGHISESYRYKLDHVEKQLISCYFVRVHNRYLVNCRAVSYIEKSSCILSNGEEIPISRAKMAQTKEIFQNYLRSVR
ncbi:MAG: response regulator transcription factor [Clostridia bacterium]|nr:response regulator transcription factor [Clostridia bacterium]